MVACGVGEDGGASGRRKVVVLAASSLTAPMAELAGAFESGHPELEIQASLGASSALREQALAGVPADVFASADPADVDRVVAGGGATGRPVVFATNRMVIAVPVGNPGAVAGLADLGRDELLVGLCAEEVPCGRYARRVLSRAGVRPAVDTLEPSVRALLTRVEAGEIDAGIVYATDAAGAARIEAVSIPDRVNLAARYAVVALADAPEPAAATAFVAFLTSAAAREILARHGFGGP